MSDQEHAARRARLSALREAGVDPYPAQVGQYTPVSEVRERFATYLQSHPAWGSLHVVLDDGNVADHFVQSCLDLAARNNDTEGVELAGILLVMSKTQRLKLGRSIR